ncbi:MAG: LLM class flavin-dependent oxidoreductase [Pseudomonadota bacterium]|nr:LLM class flavin-dependent oxidoreductase [Pseudomonadota bacterium]
MQIEIIIGCEMHPAQVADFAVKAEDAGVRALWHSNLTNGWDPFIGLVPAALATSRIKLGPLALSPYEMHPLKIAYSLSSLNELSNGRAIIGLGGGGAMALAMQKNEDFIKLDFKKMRIVRGVREAAEIIYRATSGDFFPPYLGEIFQLNLPIQTTYLKSPRPQIIACSMGPQMLRMGGRITDGVQVGDVVTSRIPEVIGEIRKGLGKRTWPEEDFRIGNFWAWHIKKDREKSMHEARRKLFARAEIIPPHIGLDHLLNNDEAEIVRDNFRNFINADIDGSGNIKNVPPDLVQRIIDEVSSAGDYDDIDREIERYKKFEKAGLTDLAIRVFDEPFKALEVISERVLPYFR